MLTKSMLNGFFRIFFSPLFSFAIERNITEGGKLKLNDISLSILNNISGISNVGKILNTSEYPVRGEYYAVRCI